MVAIKKAGRSAFRTREYAALVGNKAYAKLALHRMGRKGGIALVRRGWWAFPDAIPEAVAGEVSKPCYVSFHSGLYLHGLTTQTPREVQVAVARNARKYSALGANVREVKVNKSAFNNFSVKEGIALASPEKALADCVSRPSMCPGIVLVEASRKVNVEKVRELVTSKIARKRLEEVVKNAGKERA